MIKDLSGLRKHQERNDNKFTNCYKLYIIRSNFIVPSPVPNIRNHNVKGIKGSNVYRDTFFIINISQNIYKRQTKQIKLQ